MAISVLGELLITSGIYIFGKPEMACYKLLRETDEKLQNVMGSRTYRLVCGLLAPAQLLRKWWRGFH